MDDMGMGGSRYNMTRYDFNNLLNPHLPNREFNANISPCGHCESFRSACNTGAGLGPTGATIALERACVTAGAGSIACMIVVNAAGGLASAFLMSECDAAVEQCKAQCESDQNSNNCS